MGHTVTQQQSQDLPSHGFRYRRPILAAWSNESSWHCNLMSVWLSEKKTKHGWGGEIIGTALWF